MRSMTQCVWDAFVLRGRCAFRTAPSTCHNLPMCGRYRLSRRKQLIEEYFASASRGEDDWSPRYNVAPTQPVPVIRQNPKEPVREISLMRWGLIPAWAKDSAGAAAKCFRFNQPRSIFPTNRGSRASGRI
jgi:hypothetical protein